MGPDPHIAGEECPEGINGHFSTYCLISMHSTTFHYIRDRKSMSMQSDFGMLQTGTLLQHQANLLLFKIYRSDT